ncbi:MAG: hypothetical protein GY772_01850 [bacterium]|nr:hypothetical protein [bacterium]
MASQSWLGGRSDEEAGRERSEDEVGSSSEDVEAGAGNIRAAFRIPPVGFAGGWADPSGAAAAADVPMAGAGDGVSTQLPRTPPDWTGGMRSPSPAFLGTAPQQQPMPAAGASAQGGKGASGAASSAGVSTQIGADPGLDIMQPRVALPANFAGAKTLEDGWFVHGQTKILPQLPRLPPAAFEQKHVLQWMPIKDYQSMQTREREARRAGPKSGLDPGLQWRTDKGKCGKGKKGGGGFGPGKGKPFAGGCFKGNRGKGKGKTTRRIHRRGGRQGPGSDASGSDAGDSVASASASERSQSPGRGSLMEGAMVAEIRRRHQPYEITVNRAADGASAQIGLFNGEEQDRSAGDFPGGLGPDPTEEVVMEHQQEHMTIHFSDMLPMLRGCWKFQHEGELIAGEEHRGFGPVDMSQMMMPSARQIHSRWDTPVLLWIDGEKAHGNARAQDCMPVQWPSICLRDVLRDVNRDAIERRCSGFNIRVMNGLVRSRAFEPVMFHILEGLWPRINTYLDMVGTAMAEGRGMEARRIVPPRYLITCRAGRHRSVGVANILAFWLRQLGFKPYMFFATFGSRPSCGCPHDCVNGQVFTDEELDDLMGQGVRQCNSALRHVVRNLQEDRY